MATRKKVARKKMRENEKREREESVRRGEKKSRFFLIEYVMHKPLYPLPVNFNEILLLSRVFFFIIS